MRGTRAPHGDRTGSTWTLRWVLAPIIGLIWTTTATGQTDYFNTDGGRPLRVRDAYPVERYAFELQAAPVTLERRSGGRYGWALEPGLAYGVARGFEIEAAARLQVADAPDDAIVELGGIELAALHNLNLETRTLPAFAVGFSAVLPVGSAAPRRVHPEVTGIATRSFRWGRVHLNGSFAFGRAGTSEGEADLSRWMVGVAVDRALPLSGLLLIADAVAEQPMESGVPVEWVAEVGAKYQLSPALVLDAGLGRRMNGPRSAWALTVGAARAFGIRGLSYPTRRSP